MRKIFQYRKPMISDVDAPYLSLILSDPTEKHHKSIFGMIDTGYDGEILIPYHMYEELNLKAFEFSQDIIGYAETASGEILKLLSANASVQVKGTNLSILITIDSHERCKEVLVGRKFLESYNLLLKGREKELEIEFHFVE